MKSKQQIAAVVLILMICFPSSAALAKRVNWEVAPDEKGEKFDKTAYSATMTFNVAESLPSCQNALHREFSTQSVGAHSILTS